MSKTIDKFREGMSEDGDVDAEVFNDLCDHAETLEEQLADVTRERDSYRSPSPVDSLGWPLGRGVHGTAPREMTLDERIGGLEEAVSGLQENPPSEWLTLPWGGAVRKSEVVAVTQRGNILHMRMMGNASNLTSPEKNEAKAWLADIEGQLGIVR